MKSSLRTALAAICLCVSSLSGLAHNPAAVSDWPQWRGPERNGTSKETGLLKEWPKEGPKLSGR